MRLPVQGLDGDSPSSQAKLGSGPGDSFPSSDMMATRSEYGTDGGNRCDCKAWMTDEVKVWELRVADFASFEQHGCQM